jgi:hypothetical protein
VDISWYLSCSVCIVSLRLLEMQYYLSICTLHSHGDGVDIVVLYNRRSTHVDAVATGVVLAKI